MSELTARAKALAWSRPLLLIVAAFAAYALVYIAINLARAAATPGPAFGDFFAFWSFARFAHQFPAARLYDATALQAFQQGLPQGFKGAYPYPYPPVFLLLLWPLGWLGYIPAYLVWTGSTLGAYLAAVAGRDWRAPRLWLAAAAPTTLLSIICGQNGLLTAAMLIGGFRLLKRWPFWAGVVLGGLAFKPQLFILVPLVLLAGRRWRCLAGVTASVLGLAAASAIAFGPTIWLDWLRAAPALLRLAEDNRQRLLPLMPTVTAGLMDAGVAARIAQGAQVVVAAGVIACLAWLFHRARRTGPGDLDFAAVQVGAFLVTPYAFIYDMPMVTSGAVAAGEAGARRGGGWRLAAPIAAYVLPLFMNQGVTRGWPAGAVVLLALFATIVRARLDEKPSPWRPAAG